MEVKTNKFDHLGGGIAKDNNEVIFVKRALPNEIVDIDIIKEKKNFKEAKITKIIKSNNERCSSICPYYDNCGGCDFMHANYSLEKDFKINKCIELFNIKPNFYDTNEYNYRNKVTLHIKDSKLGFYNEKTHDITAIDYCYLLNDKINNIIKELNIYLQNNKSKIEEIIIRSTKESMLYIKGELPTDFSNYFSFVDTIIVNDKVIKGKGYIEENINNYSFKISPKSFFQVNSSGLENIFNILKNRLTTNYQNALDLYSGTSVMGILISNLCNKVISIESNKSSCNDALDNIKNNNITNIEVINDKVENIIDKLENIDLIIVDPPRSGLDNKTIEYLNKLNPKTIVYISCNMITLKRDINLLNNYQIKSIDLVNMFPKTYHCESIIVLERKK